MENKFDPIKNAPITLEVFDKSGKSVLKTKSVNKASDKSADVGDGARIVVTDCRGNTKEF